METTVKRIDDGKVELTVTLPAALVDKAVAAVYKKESYNKVKGFRPGKVPRKVLENLYGGNQYFLATATEDLLKKHYPLAVDEADLVPLDKADFGDDEPDFVEEGKDFTFKFVQQITPEFELSSYDPVTVELPSTAATDDEVKAQLDALLDYYVEDEQKPELTDEWVKETLEYEGGIVELTDRIKEAVEAQKSSELSTEKDFLVAREIASRLQGEAPEALVKQIEQELYQDLFRMLQSQNVMLDAYLKQRGIDGEGLRDDMQKQAKENAATSLALDAFARHLELEVSDDELFEEFVKSGSDKPQELFNSWRENGRLSEIRQGLRRMKTSRHLNSTAIVVEPDFKAEAKAEAKPKAKTKTKAKTDTKTEAKDKDTTKTETEKEPAKKKPAAKKS